MEPSPSLNTLSDDLYSISSNSTTTTSTTSTSSSTTTTTAKHTHTPSTQTLTLQDIHFLKKLGSGDIGSVYQAILAKPQFFSTLHFHSSAEVNFDNTDVIPSEFDDTTDTFINIPVKNYPLIITFQAFLLMLDGKRAFEVELVLVLSAKVMLEPEISLISGELPILFEPCNNDNAIVAIFGGKKSDDDIVGFGAEQVILVRDDHMKTEVCEFVGKNALVLATVEYKGLEDMTKESGDTSKKEVGTTSTPQFQCPMLKPSNYSLWAIRMQIILEANGLWEMIEPNDKTQADDRKDITAIAFLYQALPEDQLLQITKHKTAKAIWDALKTRHLGEDRVKQARLQPLKSEFELLHM
ncbi:zinc finger, CCHC-type containing protein [Tanacetum coccineum]